MRFTVSHMPRMSPCSAKAIRAYCEQLGSKRQAAGSSGRIAS